MRLSRAPAEERPSAALQIFGLLCGLVLLAARFFPFHLLPVTCPLRRATGWPCATCGMTRAFVHMTHGEWTAAWAVNPLGSILAVLTGLTALYVLARMSVLKRGWRLALTPRAQRGWALAGLLLLGANWLYLLLSGAAT